MYSYSDYSQVIILEIVKYLVLVLDPLKGPKEVTQSLLIGRLYCVSWMLMKALQLK